jgi:PAS domain S-box-containing protein
MDQMTDGGLKATRAVEIEGKLLPFAPRSIVVACSVALGYYFGGKVGFALTYQPHPVSVMWMPNAILMAALLLLPVREWWLPLSAAFCSHVAVELGDGVPLRMVLCWFMSNSLEAAMGAALTRFFIGCPARFDNLRNIMVFFICGAGMGAFFSSFLDAGFVALNHWSTEGYWTVWRLRFFSNTFSSMTIVPVIVGWTTIRPILTSRKSLYRILETFFLLSGLAVTSVSVFGWIKEGSNVPPALLYAPLPFLLWGAVRFGLRVSATAILGVACLAIWSAVHNRGPFLTSSPDQRALSIQMFFIVLSVTLLPLAAALEERKTVAHALRLSQERYREVVESQTDLVCRYLADTTLTFVNEAYCQYFRRRREDLIGRKFLEFLPVAAHEKILLGIGSLMIHRKPITVEHEVLLPDGSVGWQQWVDRPIEEADGHVRELQGIGRDITLRVRAEMALRESEERNRAILDAIPDSIFILNQAGIYLDYHTPKGSAPAVSCNQIIGRNVREVLPLHVAGELMRCLQVVAQTGETKVLEYTLSEGEHDRHFEACLVRSGADKILCLVRDITERKQVEETKQNLTHAARLAVIGELTALIAHEVNQPLAAILSNAQAAEQLLKREGVPLEEIRNIVADIRSDNLRASEAIRHIRALSQRRAISMQRLAVTELIEDTVALVAADAMRRRAQIQMRFASNLPAILGDSIHLQQVLLNLIINAMDAMNQVSEGRRFLTIRAERDPDGRVLVAVRDTGQGVRPELLPRIFQSFFSTKKDGMGVGLSIARSIIEEHGGRIWCVNNDTGGATFYVALPPAEIQPAVA